MTDNIPTSILRFLDIGILNVEEIAYIISWLRTYILFILKIIQMSISKLVTGLQ